MSAGVAWVEVFSPDRKKQFFVQERALWLVVSATESPDGTSMLMQIHNEVTGRRLTVLADRADEDAA